MGLTVLSSLWFLFLLEGQTMLMLSCFNTWEGLFDLGRLDPFPVFLVCAKLLKMFFLSESQDSAYFHTI